MALGSLGESTGAQGTADLLVFLTFASAFPCKSGLEGGPFLGSEMDWKLGCVLSGLTFFNFDQAWDPCCTERNM